MTFVVDKFWQQLTKMLIVKALPGKWRNYKCKVVNSLKMTTVSLKVWIETFNSRIKKEEDRP